MSPMPGPCPLCAAVELHDLLAANDRAVAFFDAFPVSPGHVLIVSRRHVAGLFDLSAEEQAALWALLPIVKRTVDEHHSPAGYNVGVNVGSAAGQTVGHVHVHVIPRYDGDVPDPRGGVRWVLPDRAAYWDKGR
jgi:diadenosine tetraphosphate (Ap4A) HIT family hydrolase